MQLHFLSLKINSLSVSPLTNSLKRPWSMNLCLFAHFTLLFFVSRIACISHYLSTSLSVYLCRPPLIMWTPPPVAPSEISISFFRAMPHRSSMVSDGDGDEFRESHKNTIILYLQHPQLSVGPFGVHSWLKRPCQLLDGHLHVLHIVQGGAAREGVATGSIRVLHTYWYPFQVSQEHFLCLFQTCRRRHFRLWVGVCL